VKWRWLIPFLFLYALDWCLHLIPLRFGRGRHWICCRLISVAERLDPGCQKCEYLAEGKWDGAAGIRHDPNCKERDDRRT
jgi:hypothetical protein